MSNPFFRPLAAAALISSFVTPFFPQREVGIPFKKQEAFVIEFRAPYDQLTVDIGENKIITAETLVIPITAQTALVNKKNLPIDRGMVRPGDLSHFDNIHAEP